MSRIDHAIQNIDFNICNNIEKSQSTERGFLSQNILAQLRNLIEHISLKFYANGADLEISYQNIQKSIKFVRSRGNLRILKRFHDLVQMTASHYTLDEENSERLMLKYYEYLIRVKALLKSSFGVDILGNLEKFPINTDSSRDEYYSKIAEKLNQVNPYRTKSGYNDRYYIQKIKPFFVNLNVYYEVTFTRANDNVSKFDRIIAFTQKDISHNYAVKLAISNDSIQILNKEMPIQIIENWEVSIRPCEINNFATIFGVNRQIGGNKDCLEIMKYLTITGNTLVELIDLDDSEFARVMYHVGKNGKTNRFISILERCRNLSNQVKPGTNIIRYLLYKLNNKIIKKQLMAEGCSLLSHLRLQWGCIPFDKQPFNSSLIGHNPKISHLLSCINIEDRQQELLGRFIKTNTEQKGVLYTPLKDLERFENENQLIKKWNLSLYSKHQNRRLETYKNHIYIKEYENNTYEIIKQLKGYSSAGIGSYKDSTVSWLQSSSYEIDCEEKKNALLEMFEHSKVALIYGAAGTGKSTMINHISNRFKDAPKLFLANTNPAVDNLKRKVDASNCTFQTIAKFLRSPDKSHELIIIDECSTVSNTDMINILENSSSKLLVLVGDIFQIESILFGNWFTLAKEFVPQSATFELTKPYRTTNEHLLRLWDRVRNLEDSILECITRNGYSVTLDESIFEAAEDDEIVLCLNYDGLYGINNINRFLQNSNSNPVVEWGTHIYKVGDPVLFNETDRFSPLIYNNLKGRIAGIYMSGENILFDVEIDKVINEFDALSADFDLVGNAPNGNSIIRFLVNKHRGTDHDDDYRSNTAVPFQVAYAVSIHKAQGLEYSSVKIVISNEVEEMISHNIFYTAITRARENLKIYWTPETEKKVLDSFEEKSMKNDTALLKLKYGL